MWLDDFNVEIMPGTRLTWPDRRNLLIQPGDPMDLLVVSYGLEPGTYKIRIHLDQVWPVSYTHLTLPTKA